MKNILNYDITKPDKIIYIMRGCPGSGKSTKAKSLVTEGIIHSTDNVIEKNYDYNEFFKEMNETGNFKLLSEVHEINLNESKISMDNGISPIVIDNTNLRPSEPKKYVEYALSIGYDEKNIIIVDIGTGGLTPEELSNRNTHSVPLDRIEKMVETHKNVGELTIKKILNIN